MEEETAVARAGVGLADISAFPKVSVLGRGVPVVVQHLIGDGAARKPRGVSAFVDGVLGLGCRLREDHLVLLGSATAPAPFAGLLAALPPEPPVIASDVTSAYAGFCLAGPHAEDLLRRLTSLDVSRDSFPDNSCAETGLAGVHVLLVRAPELAVPAVRVYVAWDLAEYVWEALLEAGRRLGCGPLGLEALQALRGMRD
jgi:heterotetrameric sarcosine oxidase gamma subunit